jgi:phosphatidylglycerol:prolipoprotein diacylglycerol transferase
VIGYTLWVACGLLLAALAARWQGDVTGLDAGVRQRLLLAAIAGAIVGAYGLELPADLLHWTAPPPPGRGGDAMPLGGRTVLGGLLGGWLAVEFGKRRLGVRPPTGDGFALPLALALGCGRLGCLSAGCCAGEPCAPAWWAHVDAAGQTRVPVQALEAAFHFAAAAVLAVTVRRGRRRGTALAGYLALLAVVRFLLEGWRQNPAVLAGLSYYQLVAVPLFLLAATTWWMRMRRPTGS